MPVEDPEETSPLLGKVPEAVTVSRCSQCRGWLPLVLTMAALLTAVVVALILGLVLFNDVTTASATGYYKHVAVATDAKQCSDIGLDVLKQNGSAVDAAIASVLCVGIHNAQSCGVGGGDIWVIYDVPKNGAERIMTVLDSREVAPLVSTVNMSVEGILSIGVPGNILGLHEAWQRFGRVPWRTLVEPTIALCRDGFRVGNALAHALKTHEKEIRVEPSLGEIFIKADGSLYKEGDVMTRPKLADTLETVAAEGASVFYTGSLAQDIITDIQERDGILTLEDLESYTVKWREPITVPLFGSNYTVHTAPPPFSGAIYQFVLNLIEGYNMKPFSSSDTEDEILRYHRILEAFKFGFAKRTYMGDPDFTDQSQVLANLTSRDYIASIRQKITDDITHDIMYYQPQYKPPQEGGTSHLSVLAADGGTVSVTSTINGNFGSNHRGARTGIIFNDEMTDFNSPDDVISGKLKVAATNLIKPGKRPLSSMCPTIMLDDLGNAVEIIGGAGSTKIITATVSSSMNSLLFGDELNTAIDRPRPHTKLIPNVVDLEKEFRKEIMVGLRAKGHVINIVSTESVVQGIHSYCNQPESRKDCIMAVSDWRKKGAPSGL